MHGKVSITDRYINTHPKGETLRYPHENVKATDTQLSAKSIVKQNSVLLSDRFSLVFSCNLQNDYIARRMNSICAKMSSLKI